MTDPTVSLNEKSQDECRRGFEDWFNSQGLWRAHSSAKDKLPNGDYCDPKAEGYWRVWRAAWNTRPTSPMGESLIDQLRAESDIWHGVIPYYRAEAIIRKHYEGHLAVEGKPLELQTRDELLAYIKTNETGDRFNVEPKLKVSCSNVDVIRQHQAEQPYDDQSEAELRATALYQELLKANKRIAALSRGYSDDEQAACDCYWHRTGKFNDGEFMCGQAVVVRELLVMGDAGNYSARNPTGTVGVKVPEATSPAKTIEIRVMECDDKAFQEALAENRLYRFIDKEEAELYYNFVSYYESCKAMKPVSLAQCAAASYRACAEHYNGTHDPLHNPEAVHMDIAKAVLEAAKEQGAQFDYVE